MQTSVQPTANLSQQNNVSVNPLLVSGVVFLPLFLLLTIIGYRKCQVQILRRRIEKLEIIWLLSSAKKTF
jgi:hypothetical protein